MNTGPAEQSAGPFLIVRGATFWPQIWPLDPAGAPMLTLTRSIPVHPFTPSPVHPFTSSPGVNGSSTSRRVRMMVSISKAMSSGERPSAGTEISARR
jgi:hypothetical protein